MSRENSIIKTKVIWVKPGRQNEVLNTDFLYTNYDSISTIKINKSYRYIHYQNTNMKIYYYKLLWKNVLVLR